MQQSAISSLFRKYRGHDIVPQSARAYLDTASTIFTTANPPMHVFFINHQIQLPFTQLKWNGKVTTRQNLIYGHGMGQNAPIEPLPPESSAQLSLSFQSNTHKKSEEVKLVAGMRELRDGANALQDLGVCCFAHAADRARVRLHKCQQRSLWAVSAVQCRAREATTESPRACLRGSGRASGARQCVPRRPIRLLCAREHVSMRACACAHAHARASRRMCVCG